MKEKFEIICSKLIEENEESLKQARQAVKNNTKISKDMGKITAIVLFGLFAFSAAMIVEQTHNYYIPCSIIILISVLGIIALIKYFQKRPSKKDEYNEIFQNRIIAPLMKLFYNEPYYYMPNVGLPLDEFKKAEFTHFDLYKSSNLIIGTIKDYDFKIANVNSEVNKTNIRNERYHTYTVFSGLVMKIVLPKSFDAFLYFREHENVLFKDLKDAVLDFKLNKYKVKNDNGHLDVYTSDEYFADKVLSDDIIEKILYYFELTNEVCEITIRDNCIYLMFPKSFVPGTRVILYENKQSMINELWKNYENFSFAFDLANMILRNLLL